MKVFRNKGFWCGVLVFGGIGFFGARLCVERGMNAEPVGLYVDEDKDEPFWLEVSVFAQVSKEPWGTDENLTSFFEKEGITVYGQRITERTVCEAETCPSYYLKEIKIKEADMAAVYDLLGKYVKQSDYTVSDTYYRFFNS